MTVNRTLSAALFPAEQQLCHTTESLTVQLTLVADSALNLN